MVWNFGIYALYSMFGNSGYYSRTPLLYSFLNNTGSIFGFGTQNMLSVPAIPTFGMDKLSGSASGTPTSTVQQVSSDVKEKIDNLRTLKYDDKNMKAKLNELNNVNDLSSYLTSNGKLVDTINTADDGHIYMYKDDEGNSIGSINKGKDGKIRNIALDISDGGTISINIDDNGKIESRIAMSKKVTNDKNVGKTYNKILTNYLNGEFKGVTPVTTKESDGTQKIIYHKDTKELYVIKDKDGKIKSILYAPEESNDQTQSFFDDSDGDGKIDKGEQTLRYNRFI